MNELAFLNQRTDYEVRSAVLRLITGFMAQDLIYEAIVQSVADMDVALDQVIGQVDFEALEASSASEARALRALMLDLLRQGDRASEAEAIFALLGETVIESATDSVTRALALMLVWPHIEAGYADIDRRAGVWARVRGGQLPTGSLMYALAVLR